MMKNIWKPLVPVFKWTSVAALGAAIVISIQANADGENSDSQPAIGQLEVQDLAPTADEPVAAKRSEPWTPASGFADLIEDVNPAVVHVATAGIVKQRSYRGFPRQREFRGPRGFEDFFDDFFNRRFPDRDPRNQDREEDNDDSEQQTRPLGIGSGFVISADGYVVTNHHVIDRADEIIVTLADGKEYMADIEGSDPKTDLALLKLQDAEDLPYVEWGNDEKSRVGDWVLAIGNPFGLGGSASTGIISAIGRDINAGPYDDFIQVDAAINRGNSGGPLFNMRGEVIGINSMIYSPSGGSVGIGFAIPASLAKGVIGQLKNGGSVERGYIGVSIGPVTEELAAAFQRDDEDGALVSEVKEGSPAEKAGVRVGDIILTFDGEKIDKVRSLPKVVAQASVGKTYRMEVWRDGKKKNLRITTERFPDDEQVASSDGDSDEEPQSDADNMLGAELSSLTDSLRSQYRIGDSVDGVLVLNVERGGLAAKSGLVAGDVIVQIGSKNQLSTPDDVIDTVKAAKDADRPSLPVLINRRGATGFQSLKLK